eukprot:TRINITY_DN113427_c0_g1_i1.p1 TRINITY_DN113427_c0_g1~~TRINITY_DN113427_c0_g1_i1.p1  ORF type:complete len:291 (+),score=62.40 TRINITY_DN113427_c0_g1_i1:36-875(+)
MSSCLDGTATVCTSFDVKRIFVAALIGFALCGCFFVTLACVLHQRVAPARLPQQQKSSMPPKAEEDGAVEPGHQEHVQDQQLEQREPSSDLGVQPALVDATQERLVKPGQQEPAGYSPRQYRKTPCPPKLQTGKAIEMSPRALVELWSPRALEAAQEPWSPRQESMVQIQWSPRGLVQKPVAELPLPVLMHASSLPTGSSAEEAQQLSPAVPTLQIPPSEAAGDSPEDVGAKTAIKEEADQLSPRAQLRNMWMNSVGKPGMMVNHWASSWIPQGHISRI